MGDSSSSSLSRNRRKIKSQEMGEYFQEEKENREMGDSSSSSSSSPSRNPNKRKRKSREMGEYFQEEVSLSQQPAPLLFTGVEDRRYLKHVYDKVHGNIKLDQEGEQLTRMPHPTAADIVHALSREGKQLTRMTHATAADIEHDLSWEGEQLTWMTHPTAAEIEHDLRRAFQGSRQLGEAGFPRSLVVHDPIGKLSKKPCSSQIISAADSEARWSKLPIDIATEIASVLPSNNDYVSFRSVCSSWHTSFPRTIPFPLLLYPAPCRDELDGRNFISFVDLSIANGDEMRIVDIPEARGHVYCGSGEGRIVIRTNGCRPPFGISILHAVTRNITRLPRLNHLPEKIVLVEEVAAVAILGQDLPLAFWIVGDKKWNMSPIPRGSPRFHDVIVRRNKLVAVDSFGTVYMFPSLLPDTEPAPQVSVQASQSPHIKKYYIIA